MTRQRISIVGIDGAGKSTVLRHLLSTASAAGAVAIHCPAYHTDPDAPLGALSRAMEAFSQAADELGCFELKAAALYMQMTLYGPVEAALEHAFRPRWMLGERHPIVDTLAYGAFYQQMVRKPLRPADWEGPLEAAMDERIAGGYRAVRDWHETEMRRLGRSTSFWEVAHDVCAELERNLSDLLEELSGRYRTGLPDQIVLLDVDAADAEARVRARSEEAGAASELHETSAYLAALRKSYAATLDALGRVRSDIRVHRISTGARSIEACVAEVLAAVGMEVSHERTA